MMSNGRPTIKHLAVMVIPISLLIIGFMFFILNDSPGERTVESFCARYYEQNDVLSKKTEGTYSLSFFDGRSSDPTDYIGALSELKSVSPVEIEQDLETLIKTFEIIDEDPSKALDASLGAIGPESTVENWINDNCSDQD